MVQALTFSLLFFLPFVIIPFGISPFESPKVILAEILIEFLLLIFLFKKGFFISLKNQKTQIIIALIIIALSFFHLVFVQNPTGFFGNPIRLQGIFLLWHLIILFILSSKLTLHKIPAIAYPICMVFLFVATIIFGGDENGRTIGTLGEPNALAATAAFFLPFLLFRQKIAIKILGVLLALIIVFLSGSRSGLIAIFMQSIFLILNKGLKLSILKSFVIALALLILSFSLPLFEGCGLFENRSVIWQTSMISGINSPIFGNGFGNIDNALKQASIQLDNFVQYQFVDSAHNIFLDFWAEGGIIGLGVFITILFLSIKNLISDKKIFELTTLIGLLTVLSFNPASVVTLIAFWWILGQGFNQKQI